MSIKAVKGTRDFYPDVMRLRNWIVDAWRRVSLRNGFEEYDAPIFEYLDLFTIKSGQEIASQLFNFTDRGGRSLAIRPEITPSLARMVNAKINALPRPIKWFSVPRVCRAENPQRGRLREFFQWNVDVIGSDSVLADAECIFTAVDFLREVGLTAEDVQVRIGSRALTSAIMTAAGVKDEDFEKVLAVLDKRPKVSEDDFTKLAREAGLNDDQLSTVRSFQDADSLAAAEVAADGCADELDQLRRVLTTLETMGVGDFCRLDLRIVRGLAYYTGVVYEVFDAKQSLRAVAGGGRYDNLLEVLGGPAVGACGFGMGDVVLGILLEEKGKIPQSVTAGELEFFVIPGDEGLDKDEKAEKALKTVAALRSIGRSADFSYKGQAIGKQLKEANRRKAAKAVIIRGDTVAVKDLSGGDQTEMTLDAFLAACDQSGAHNQ